MDQGYINLPINFDKPKMYPLATLNILSSRDALINFKEIITRERVLIKGPVIIYDQGGEGSNDFLWKIFLRPTRRAKKKIRGLLDIA